MKWIVAYIKWVMLVAGILTTTMLYTAIAPDAAMQSSFGQTLEGPRAGWCSPSPPSARASS